MSNNAHPNSYLREWEGQSKGVPRSMVLSNGALFTYGHDHKYRLSTQDGSAVKVVDIQEPDIEYIEMPGGKLLCWAGAKVTLLNQSGELLRSLKIETAEGKDEKRPSSFFVFADGRFFALGKLSDAPMVWSSDGDPLYRLSGDGYNSEVCGALELPNGRFVTWRESFPNHIIWNSDGTVFRQLPGHNLELYDLILTSNDRMVSCAADGWANVYNLEGDILFELKADHHIWSVREILGGKLLMETDNQAEERVWNIYSLDGEYEKTLETGELFISPILVLRNGMNLSVSWDGITPTLWTAEGEIGKALIGHTHRVKGAIQLKDDRIVTWSEDNSIRLWGTEGQPLGALQGHVDNIDEVVQLDSGELLSSSRDGRMLIWDSAQATGPREAHAKDIDGVFQLEDGSILTWCQAEGEIRIWDISGEFLRIIKPETKGRLKGIKRLLDGRYISWGTDRFNRILTPSFEYSHMIDGYSDDYGTFFQVTENLLQLRDGKIVTSVRGKIRVMDLEGTLYSVFAAYRYCPAAMRETADGHILSWGDETGTGQNIFSIHGTDGTLIAKVNDKYAPLPLLDGRIITWGHTLKYYSATGSLMHEIEADRGSWPVKQLEDGRLLTVHDGLVQFRTADGELLEEQPSHTKTGMFSTSLTGGRILTWGYGPILTIRDQDWTPQILMEGHQGIVLGAVQMDCGRIVSWGGDHYIRIWTENGEALSEWKSEHPITQILPLKRHSEFAVTAANELYVLRYR